ncbi:MAG: hypothetical protein Ct9H300mP8_11210 [Gammaproteobacteria bacterium]|nr:MAG: hypothetical protein Ct9H300mP8_11210 [Gammaproteobacteria bacterium]
MNSVLTVGVGVQGRIKARAGKRLPIGRRRVDRDREHVVFMLWGSYAQRKGEMVSRDKHCVLKAPHPSPYRRIGDFSVVATSRKRINIWRPRADTGELVQRRINRSNAIRGLRNNARAFVRSPGPFLSNSREPTEQVIL